ncbi:unnamed protein product [Paramecium sonneborni]|nr:unnamed protein product [Paramecium sonneborni]
MAQMNPEGMKIIEIDNNIQSSKQLLENSQYKQNQQEYQVRKLIKSNRKQKNIDRPKVILSLSQQTQRPFQTIANYVNEKTTSLRDLSFGKIPISTNKKPNFIPNKSFAEFQDLVSSPKYSQKKSNLIQSCLNLPDIKFNYSSRLNNQNPYLIRRGNKSYQNLFLHSQKAL